MATRAMNTPEVVCFILLTAFVSTVTLILVIFFPQVSRQEQKDFFHLPNKSPHTEVNNINTCVAGVRVGVLFKPIFQNVFLLLLQLRRNPHPEYVPSHNKSLCDVGPKAAKGCGRRRPGV